MLRYILYTLLAALAAYLLTWFVPPALYIAIPVFIVLFLAMAFQHIRHNAALSAKAAQERLKRAQENQPKLVNRTKTRSTGLGSKWLLWGLVYAGLFVGVTMLADSARAQFQNRPDAFSETQAKFEARVELLKSPDQAQALLDATQAEIGKYGGQNDRYDTYLNNVAMSAWFTLINRDMAAGHVDQARKDFNDLKTFASQHNLSNPAIGFAESALTNAELAANASGDASNANANLAALNNQLGLVNGAWTTYGTNPDQSFNVTGQLTSPLLSGTVNWINETKRLREENANLNAAVVPAAAEDSLCSLDHVVQVLTNPSGHVMTFTKCKGEKVTYMVCWKFSDAKPPVCYPQMSLGDRSPGFFMTSTTSFTVLLNQNETVTPTGDGPWSAEGQ